MHTIIIINSSNNNNIIIYFSYCSISCCWCPDLGDLLTLIGAVASSGLAMIFPPLIHILTYCNQQQSLTIEGDLNGGVTPTRIHS